jgi:hypothetical protein
MVNATGRGDIEQKSPSIKHDGYRFNVVVYQVVMADFVTQSSVFQRTLALQYILHQHASSDGRHDSLPAAHHQY